MNSIPPAERARLFERLIGACIAHGIDVAKHAVQAKAAEPLTVQPPKPEPVQVPVIVQRKKDPELEAVIALADRRATELLRSLGLE
jgi:hypothetical protein